VAVLALGVALRFGGAFGDCVVALALGVIFGTGAGAAAPAAAAAPGAGGRGPALERKKEGAGGGDRRSRSALAQASAAPQTPASAALFAGRRSGGGCTCRDLVVLRLRARLSVEKGRRRVEDARVAVGRSPVEC
jgi:hypothetical protein